MRTYAASRVESSAQSRATRSASRTRPPAALPNHVVQRQLSHGGSGEEDPVHRPLLDDWRRRHGFDESTGPSDAELKYRGGLTFGMLPPKTVNLNVTLLHGVADTVSRDVTQANSVWFNAGIVFAAGTPTTLDAPTSTAILQPDTTFDCGTRGPQGDQATDEELRLVRHNLIAGMLNVYYVPRFNGCNDAAYAIRGISPDPTIIVDQNYNQRPHHAAPLEHELGHALGLPHRGDGYQLMHDGLRADNQLIQSEINAARQSPYAR